MAKTNDLQVMQETLRVLITSLAGVTQLDLAKLAQLLGSGAFLPGLDPQTRLCLTDLAEGLTAIAPVQGPRQ